MAKIITETKRCWLTEITEEHVDGLFELDSDPEVHRYLGNHPIQYKEQAFDVVVHIRKQYIELGIGRWAVIDKSNNGFVGWAGLKRVTETINKHQDYLDLGYRLIRKYWNQGFASECAMASLHYGFEILNEPVIYAAAHVDNLYSNKILTKLGFRFIETFKYEEDTDNWYELHKTDWLTKKNLET